MDRLGKGDMKKIEEGGSRRVRWRKMRVRRKWGGEMTRRKKKKSVEEGVGGTKNEEEGGKESEK
jgi:hypothetical protein